MQEIKERAKELLASGQVQRVLGWKRGEDLPYNPQPAFFEQIYDSGQQAGGENSGFLKTM